MAKRRIPFLGLFAGLLALMAQLGVGVGASVPRLNSFRSVIATDMICHGPEDGTGDPSPSAPVHPLDCLVCPLCIALHASPTDLVSNAPVIRPSGLVTVLRSELPPPSTAPPSPHRPPTQPRAPPVSS